MELRVRFDMSDEEVVQQLLVVVPVLDCVYTRKAHKEGTAVLRSIGEHYWGGVWDWGGV